MIHRAGNGLVTARQATIEAFTEERESLVLRAADLQKVQRAVTKMIKNDGLTPFQERKLDRAINKVAPTLSPSK